MNDHAILSIESLTVEVGQSGELVHAVRDASISVPRGSRLGIIGESGSGKSMTALSVLRLLPPGGRVVSGAIVYEGHDLLSLSEEEMRRVRGKEIALIFQNAQASLNPLFPVGAQIADAYRFHEGGSKRAAWEKAVEMLNQMGIPSPVERARAYPHQYSGGMAQRAMIAVALVCSPKILIADEPTSGLDLTIQAQVLQLIREHVDASGATLVLISHDLAVIAELCTDVVVLYAGEVMESGKRSAVFAAPRHPYTRALVDCFYGVSGRRLPFIAGRVPDLRNPIVGCAFASRCPLAQARCHAERPALREVAPGQMAACHFA